MRYLLCMLLLASCATAHHTTYHQSAFPGAAEFSAAEDAPHNMGQPGYVGEPEKVPQSPHKRRLPTSSEQRVYAGDAPSSTNGVPSRTLLGVPLPEAEDDEARKFRAICATSMGMAAKRGEYANLVSALSENERRCLAARLYNKCVDDLLSEFERIAEVVAPGIPEHVVMDAMRKAEPITVDFVRAECRSPSKDVDVLAHDIGLAWRHAVIDGT